MGWTEHWVKVPKYASKYDNLASNSLLNLRGQKLSCPCYHARHLQQIHWSKLLCGMYGFTVSQRFVENIILRFLFLKENFGLVLQRSLQYYKKWSLSTYSISMYKLHYIKLLDMIWFGATQVNNGFWQYLDQSSIIISSMYCKSEL